MSSLESLELSTILPASPERLYQAWLDSAEHTAITGSAAEIDPSVGGRFTAWDGYIAPYQHSGRAGPGLPAGVGRLLF